MIGPLRPTGPHAPKVWSKYDYRQKKEDAGDFKPQDAAHTLEGAQKAANAASDTPTGLSDFSGRLRRHLGPGCRIRGRLGLGLGSRSRFHRSFEALARHLAGDAKSGAEDTPNGLWSHSVYDGSSDAG
jgi:hypothetical protein